jgi:hypothetical protein
MELRLDNNNITDYQNVFNDCLWFPENGSFKETATTSDGVYVNSSTVSINCGAYPPSDQLFVSLGTREGDASAAQIGVQSRWAILVDIRQDSRKSSLVD